MIASAWRWIADALRRARETIAVPTVPEHVDVIDPAGARAEAAGPMLMVDLYWKDVAGAPNWPRLLTARWGPDVNGNHWPYYGAMLKATQGTSYYRNAIAWFGRGWRALAAAERVKHNRDHDFVRAAYHYLNFWQDGSTQARYYLRTIDLAGGWEDGDALPVVDVEFGSDARQRAASRAQVEDCLAAWVETVYDETGRDVILYGGSALSELRLRYGAGIPDRCTWLWPAAYSRTLKSTEWTRLGYRGDQVALWQYTDGDVCRAVTTKGTTLPRVVPGFGAVDCSVFLAGRTLPDFVHVLTHAPGPDVP